MAVGEFYIRFLVVALMSVTTAQGLMLGLDELSRQFLPLAHVSPLCLEPIDYVPPRCSTRDMVLGEVLNETMWYYSPDQLKCVSTVKFTGCATDNRFDNLETCSSTCESGTHCPYGCYTVHDPYRRDKLRCVCPKEITDWLCHLPADEGDCRKMNPVPTIQRYYFDPEEKACKAFTFSRCGGNQNNFGSSLMCKDVCAYEPEKESSYNLGRLLVQILLFILLVATAFHFINCWFNDQPSFVVEFLNQWVPLRKSRATFNWPTDESIRLLCGKARVRPCSRHSLFVPDHRQLENVQQLLRWTLGVSYTFTTLINTLLRAFTSNCSAEPFTSNCSAEDGDLDGTIITTLNILSISTIAGHKMLALRI
ncbi:Pancreatic trypsin inhibitor Kunitz domain [Trinorchestia longiramus]|nr:Pancreatic trypsin inhibitor Kunitz domain [Trinorchestia longiramus]